MTLGGSGRGPSRHREELDAGRGVELEELPTQPVTSGGGSRLSIGAALAIGAIALMVAVGLGLFGGRRPPTPTDAVADGPRASPQGSAEQDTGAPPVTPTTACEPDVLDPASIFLEVGGFAYPPSEAPTPAGTPGRIDMHGDGIAQISVGAEPCTVEWRVQLVEGAVVVPIADVEDPGRDPGIAGPNPFRFVLASLEARDAELLAMLTLPGGNVHLSWAVHLVPFEAPRPILRVADREITLDQACAVELTLADGQRQPIRPCADDLASNPPQVVAATSGEPLTFGFPAGWEVETAILACGTVQHGKLVDGGAAGCPDLPRFDDGVVALDAPLAAGVWTLAISTCASQGVGFMVNRICGTWYARLRVAT